VRKARVLTQAAAEQGGAQTAPGGEEGETQAGDAGAGGTAGEEQQELVQQAIENGVAVDVITTDDAAASGATEIDQAQQDQAQQEEHAQQEGASSEENAADSEFGKVLVGEAEIDAQTKEATELQEKRDELEDPLPVQLIATEAAAVVANGDGDVATTGNCAVAFDQFCKSVLPGDGRFADCLTEQMQQEENGNVEGQMLSDQCKNEVRAFKADRATNINKNLPLAKACKKDARKFCKDVKAKKDTGATLACLRKEYKKLSTRCQAEVFETMEEGAEDMEADAMLNNYCKADAEKLCADIEPGAGRTQACLMSMRGQPGLVHFECLEELFRQEVEDANDIRLSIVLLRVCMGEKQAFCQHVVPGHADTFECLEQNRNSDGFGQQCREQIEEVMQRRSLDFRLNPKLATACDADIRDTCGVELGRMDYVHGVDGKVLNCLQDHREELKAPECTEEVHKNMERRSEDVRFNYPLAHACREDRARVCPDLNPGSARIIGCFQQNRNQLSFECKAALFDQEQQMAEDIDFLYPLKRACANEIPMLCSEVPHGHARIVRCLQENLDDPVVGRVCRLEVQKENQRQGTDYRLNFRLKQACEHDVARLCPDACVNATTTVVSETGVGTGPQACGGKALRCLTEKLEDVQSDACANEVIYFEQMEVADFRNDILLAEACRQDVAKYCKKVEPGEGRTLACLRQNREKLQPDCRREELQLSLLAARDIRLRPKLKKLCSEEMTVFCAEVKPGRGRMMRCLQENLSQPQFSEACRQEVAKREEAMQADFRENAGLASTCAPEIEDHCQAEQGQAHNQGKVLKCLLRMQSKKKPLLSDECDDEVSRAARMALWEYTPGAALTKCCDHDVEGYCALEQHKRVVYSIGHVGKCLATQLAAGHSLASECQQLILAAAPQDSRALINAKSAQKMLAAKMRETQMRIRAAALNSQALAHAKLIDKEAQGANIITLSGWFAFAGLAAMVMVAIVGALFGIRRLLGPRQQPYTVLVPRDGDA